MPGGAAVAGFAEAGTEWPRSARGCVTSAAQMREAADTLFSVLGLLPLPDSTYLRGCGMRCEAAYGLLHFFVRYEGVVSAVREIPVMEDLKRVQTSD